MKLVGIMFWAPDLDDFSGTQCKEGRYPLMTYAVRMFRGETNELPLTSTVSTLTTQRTTVKPSRPSPFNNKRSVCYYTK